MKLQPRHNKPPKGYRRLRMGEIVMSDCLVYFERHGIIRDLEMAGYIIRCNRGHWPIYIKKP